MVKCYRVLSKRLFISIYYPPKIFGCIKGNWIMKALNRDVFFKPTTHIIYKAFL